MEEVTKGHIIQLTNQEQKVIECDKCSRLMVNIDADELKAGDLTLLKGFGVLVSNPETEKDICVRCEYVPLGKRIADFFETDDNDDDSGFFGSSSGSFGGSSGFGGFSGGMFGGGGASRSW